MALSSQNAHTGKCRPKVGKIDLHLVIEQRIDQSKASDLRLSSPEDGSEQTWPIAG